MGISGSNQIAVRMIKYYLKHGATKAANRYKVSRKTVYKWLKRYDGTIDSLKDRSRRPHNSPKAHTKEEITMIIRALKKVKWTDLILAYLGCISEQQKRSLFLRPGKGL